MTTVTVATPNFANAPNIFIDIAVWYCNNIVGIKQQIGYIFRVLHAYYSPPALPHRSVSSQKKGAGTSNDNLIRRQTTNIYESVEV